MSGASLSYGFIKDLYLQVGQYNRAPIVQILAFESSANDPKEIIIRISDQQCFLDCLLLGPYTLRNGIISSMDSSALGQRFIRYDLVRISDYFCKIDDSKMCRLKIIIRRIVNVHSAQYLLGRPEYASEFINSNYEIAKQEMAHPSAATRGTSIYVSKTHYRNERISGIITKSYSKQRQNAPSRRTYTSKGISILDITESILGTASAPIKIEEDDYNYNIQPKFGSQLSKKSADKPNKKYYISFLTTFEVMNRTQGIFLGRLVRHKCGVKYTKEGLMSYLIIGLVDRNQDLLRVTTAGRTAIKLSRYLKRHKCYSIKGLEVVEGRNNYKPKLSRLRDKYYHIQEVVNDLVIFQLPQSYYQWDHDAAATDADLVDVVGMIEYIEEKRGYVQNNTIELQREVVRVVVRNVLKTVKISFWSDQLKTLEQAGFRKKQMVLFEDIKKKKSIFLDFTGDSNFIDLDSDLDLKASFAQLLPAVYYMPVPTNLRELLYVQYQYPSNTTLRTLNLNLSHIKYNRVIYRFCAQCKHVEREYSCSECSSREFICKYNCLVDFSDATGTASCVLFDSIAEKLFGMSAYQMKKLYSSKMKDLLETLYYNEYKTDGAYHVTAHRQSSAAEYQRQPPRDSPDKKFYRMVLPFMIEVHLEY